MTHAYTRSICAVSMVAQAKIFHESSHALVLAPMTLKPGQGHPLLSLAKTIDCGVNMVTPTQLYEDVSCTQERCSTILDHIGPYWTISGCPCSETGQ